VREPVRRVHNDYTERSGPQRVRDLLPAEAEELLKHRFAVIQTWRPIRNPVMTAPLAIADARTLPMNDMILTERRYPDRVGEIYHIAYNPAHRWYYFPNMRRNEALVFKTYDSAKDGRARWTAHAAFDDPTSPPDAPQRESIEIRALAFF
jgi:cation transport regulator ChaB